MQYAHTITLVAVSIIDSGHIVTRVNYTGPQTQEAIQEAMLMLWQETGANISVEEHHQYVTDDGEGNYYTENQTYYVMDANNINAPYDDMQQYI